MSPTRCVLSCLIFVAIATPAAFGAFEVYKNVPDVDKPDRDGDGKWPDSGDNSCWLAAAANMLAGAGAGKAGQTAQKNGEDIYKILTDHFGTQKGGLPHIALNWWQHNYTYNYGQKATGFYDPAFKYNDVTLFDPPGKWLTKSDYTTLLDELDRCQYVHVGVQTKAGGAHSKTLIGGNKPGQTDPTKEKSVFHDSDHDFGGLDDEIYGNQFNTYGSQNDVWQMDYDGDGTFDATGARYTLLCPGLQKPKRGVEEYDVAFFRDRNKDSSSEFVASRVAGTHKDLYDPPKWESDTILLIDNVAMPDPWRKQVWLLVDYLDRDNKADPGIKLDFGTGLTDPTSIKYSNDKGQILLRWDLPLQPEWEKVIFPNSNYKNLSGDVKDFNLSTDCWPIPEPAAISIWSLIGALVITVGCWRKRRRAA